MNKRSINTALVGYGKVGKLLRDLIENDPLMELSVITDRNDKNADARSINEVNLENIDLIIDFSEASSVKDLVKHVAQNSPKTKIVTGTSGWMEDQEEIRSMVKKYNLYFLYGANFSIGTNLFMKLAEKAGELFSNHPEFDPSLFEIHHRHKKDMPSGTAKAIAETLSKKFDPPKEILYGNRDGALDENEFHVASLRVGENMGFHEVIFDSFAETIKISQQTHDRGSYAKGALFAAKWLCEKDAPGYYTFRDVLDNL